MRSIFPENIAGVMAEVFFEVKIVNYTPNIPTVYCEYCDRIEEYAEAIAHDPKYPGSWFVCFCLALVPPYLLVEAADQKPNPSSIP